MKNILHKHCVWRALLLWLGSFCFFSSSAQMSFISGIVNSYYPVADVVPSKSCVLTNNTAGLTPGKKVMIIQMKGATINTSNSSSFGDVTNMNSAGNYEIAYVCYTNEDSVFLVHELLNQYSPLSGKVQLVLFASYPNATVTDTLKAKSWDNATGTGGVLALDVTGQLILNAPLFADSTGFRGGRYMLSDGNCSNFIFGYNYNGTPSPMLPTQNGAFKGEGIAEPASAGQTGGRGAPANGGGGGNNHNNSGGGGSNLSAGGLGGGNSSYTGSGCYTSYRGEPGKALNNDDGQRIFSGGGGGAGHNNSGLLATGGGHGGGILFLQASTLTGNNQTISANGGKGWNSLGDGAGGGGGGGTIILDVDHYVSNVVILANGGNGGNSNDNGNGNKCFGGGGGGSGGVIFFTGANPVVTTYDTAGRGGIETNRDDANCAAPQPAAGGTNGMIITNYNYRTSPVLAATCGTILPMKLLSFTAVRHNFFIQLQWQIVHPEQAADYIIEKSADAQHWNILEMINSVDTSTDYRINDAGMDIPEIYYRLKIIGKDNSVTYSVIRKVRIGTPPVVVHLYPNPSSGSFTISRSITAKTEIILFNMAGKVILHKTILGRSAIIDASVVAKGVYFLHIDGVICKYIRI